MKTAIRTITLALVLLLTGGAMADVSNGDFEAGITDWGMFAPPTWIIGVNAAGGNPDAYGHIQSPWGDSAGMGCFRQDFQCGVEDPSGASTCLITFDYFLHNLDATPGSGRVIVSIDGLVMYVSPAGMDWIDWTTVTLVVPCGYHTISLCLEVDPQNNGWEAGFDNVIAECDDSTPTEEINWSTIKSLY
jgi:hypothetical protein